MPKIMFKANLKTASGLRSASRHPVLCFFADNLLTASGTALEVDLVRIFAQN
jgi:hypothetical protein